MNSGKEHELLYLPLAGTRSIHEAAHGPPVRLTCRNPPDNNVDSGWSHDE